ncbi:PadR family transcriptional regulator, partial [Priestia megaterium]
KSVYKQNKENWEQAKKIIDLLL